MEQALAAEGILMIGVCAEVAGVPPHMVAPPRGYFELVLGSGIDEFGNGAVHRKASVGEPIVGGWHGEHYPLYTEV